MTMPATDSVTPRSDAMSVSSAMGMNSDVLKMNAESVMPSRGSHERSPIFSPRSLVIPAPTRVPPLPSPNLRRPLWQRTGQRM